MRCAVVNINANLIENVIVADPAIDAPPDGFMLALVPDFVNPGDAWNGGVFPEPQPVAVPTPPAGESKVVDGMEML